MANAQVDIAEAQLKPAIGVLGRALRIVFTSGAVRSETWAAVMLGRQSIT